MNSTDIVTTFIVEDSVVKEAVTMLEKDFGYTRTDFSMDINRVTADQINLEEGSFHWGESRLHEAYVHCMEVAVYDDDDPDRDEQIAEAMAEYLVDSDRIEYGSSMAVEDRMSDQTIGAFVMSENAYAYTGDTHPFLALVEAIKSRQRKFGWKEVEVYVLRENGNFEFC